MKKKKKNPGAASAVEETGKSELDAPIWSVVKFDSCVADGLTYDEAAETLEKLKAEKVSGLCIVTNEAAARMKH